MRAEALRRARPVIDPSSAEQVRRALARLLAERGVGGVRFIEEPRPIRGGFDTLIYGFRVEGEDVPSEWRQPLVVRIFAALDQDARATREAQIQLFATRCGYPALAPLVAEGPDNPFGFPIMILPRVAGGTLAERMLRNPFRLGRWLERMAKLQIALHELPVESCPLRYEGTLIDRRLVDVRARLERHGLTQLADAYAWLEQCKGHVQSEVPAVCHADFHPLNILVDDAERLVLIDWAEVEIGDRHFDLGRTLAAFWFAKLGARHAPERVLLQALRGILRKRYLAAYAAGLPLDALRLAYWEAYHVFIAWLLVSELPFDTRVAKPAAVTGLSHDFAEEVRERFWHCTRQFAARAASS